MTIAELTAIEREISIREPLLVKKSSDKRGYEIADKSRNNRTERRTDNDGYGKADHVAFHDKLFEIFKRLFHIMTKYNKSI